MMTDERYKGVLSMALKPISKIAAGVQASTTLAIDSLFKQMKAEGKDVVGFGAGEPCPAAVGRNLILGQAERISNAGISVPELAELRDLVFLFVCHSDLQSEGLSFSSH